MNVLEEFDRDCEPYFDKYGFFKRNPQDQYPDGNPNVYNGVRACIRHYLGWVTTGFDNAAFGARISKIMRNPGLLDRSVEKLFDKNAFDDYLAVLTESKLTDGGRVAYQIWKHGMENDWYFQNIEGGFFKNFSLSFFFFRILGFKPHAKHCSYDVHKIKLSKSEEIRWALDVILTTYTERPNTNGRQKDFLMITAMRDAEHYKICQFAIRFRDNRFMRKYPNGYQDVASIYYEPPHPFAKHSKDIK